MFHERQLHPAHRESLEQEVAVVVVNCGERLNLNRRGNNENLRGPGGCTATRV
jgi:hypothetical protein